MSLLKYANYDIYVVDVLWGHRSSWSKLFLLQNFMNIDGTTLFFKQSTFETSEALQKPAGTKKTKSRLFHQYSWNSEVETTWISLILWPHRTSNIYVCIVFMYLETRALKKSYLEGVLLKMSQCTFQTYYLDILYL